MENKKTFLLPNRNPFDIHLYFNKETLQSALAIRTKMSEDLPVLTFYDPHLEAIGPHPLPMWEADFSISKNLEQDLGKAVLWLMENRNGHSVLIHPHTGDLTADHTTNSIWLGDKLQLKLDMI